jgi:hypothetical protein
MWKAEKKMANKQPHHNYSHSNHSGQSGYSSHSNHSGHSNHSSHSNGKMRHQRPRPRRLPLKMQNFDSNGPDLRIRGTAHQILEKYLTHARDSSSSGDKILAENYYQHAEHYLRLIQIYAQEEALTAQRSAENEESQEESMHMEENMVVSTHTQEQEEVLSIAL